MTRLGSTILAAAALAKMTSTSDGEVSRYRQIGFTLFIKIISALGLRAVWTSLGNRRRGPGSARKLPDPEEEKAAPRVVDYSKIDAFLPVPSAIHRGLWSLRRLRLAARFRAGAHHGFAPSEGIALKGGLKVVAG